MWNLHRSGPIGWLMAALVCVLLLPAAASAAEPSGLIAAGYWAGFWDFWSGQFKKQDSIVLLTLGVGAVSIFIITRGKWKK